MPRLLARLRSRRPLLRLLSTNCINEEDPYLKSLRQSGEWLVSPQGQIHIRAPIGVRGERHTRLMVGTPRNIRPKILTK